MKLRYGTVALRQIDAALSYIKARSPQGAATLQERIVLATALLEGHPRAGQATNRPNTRRLVLTPYPYVLLYRVTANEIIIMRFRHSAQKQLSGLSQA